MDVTVIGATGYAGAELIRLIIMHPKAELIYAMSKSGAGHMLSEYYPSIGKSQDIQLTKPDYALAGEKSDVIFTALPHGVSAGAVYELSKYGKPIIDLSGDFRYDDPSVYDAFYPQPHPHPEMLANAIYGMSEIYSKEIKNAKIIGNPGCYTTCNILPLTPIVAAGIIDNSKIVIDSKSGTSGAGKSLSAGLHFTEVANNVKAYKVTNHRHTSEIEQELSKAAGEEIALSFTPHLLPIKRGIITTIYTDLKKQVSHEDIGKLYEDMYGKAPFINLRHNKTLPELKDAVGSNSLHIGWIIDKRLNKLIIAATLDNLIKGAAGQAIQNMNIIAGFDETTGLNQTAWYL